MARQHRPAPPPLEANDQVVTGTITAAWAIALIVVVLLRDQLPANERWWIWTCATGFAMGLFGLWYVPRLKRKRARLAERRAAALRGAGPQPAEPRPAESQAVEPHLAGPQTAEPQAPGPQAPGPQAPGPQPAETPDHRSRGGA